MLLKTLYLEKPPKLAQLKSSLLPVSNPEVAGPNVRSHANLWFQGRPICTKYPLVRYDLPTLTKKKGLFTPGKTGLFQIYHPKTSGVPFPCGTIAKNPNSLSGGNALKLFQGKNTSRRHLHIRQHSFAPLNWLFCLSFWLIFEAQSLREHPQASGNRENLGGTVDGRNPAPLSNHWKPVFVGIYRGIIIPGLLRWCRISSIYSM